MDTRNGIGALCEAVMRAFAVASRDAGQSSPLAQARARLGNRYAEVACASMRARIKALLSPDGARQALQLLDGTGRLGEHAVLAGLVSDICQDVIAAA